MKKVQPRPETTSRVVGAIVTTGKPIVGKLINGGIYDPVELLAIPVEDADDGKNALRLQMHPAVPFIFTKMDKNPDIPGKHIIRTYELPAQVIDAYLEQQTGIAKSSPVPEEGEE